MIVFFFIESCFTEINCELNIVSCELVFLIRNKQNKTLIAVYGNTTEEAAKARDLRIDIKAPTEVSPSMAMAIEKYIKS